VIRYALCFVMTGALAQEQCVVPTIRDGMDLVQAEHEWLRKTYGGGSLVRQAIGASTDGKKRFDIIVWRKPDGEVVEVCFDVTTVSEESIRRVEEEETSGSHRPAR